MANSIALTQRAKKAQGGAGELQFSDGAGNFNSSSNLFYNGSELQVYSGDNYSRFPGGFVTMYRYGVQPGVNMVRYNGTAASPTAIASGNVITTIGALGYNGSTLITGAAINTVASQNWTGSASGTNIDVRWTLDNLSTNGLYAQFTTNSGKPALFLGNNLTSADTNATFHSRITSGSNYNFLQTDSIGNSQANVFYARAIGASTRNAFFGIFKNLANTNPNGYFGIQQENGTIPYLWVDNATQFRISVTASHIGTTSGTVIGTQTSDLRVKHEIQDSSYGLTEIMQIESKQFKMIDDPDQTQKLGFIAQQVLPIIPESVYDTKEDVDGTDNTKLAMDYTQLIPVLVKAIQEQQTKINELEQLVKGQ